MLLTLAAPARAEVVDPVMNPDAPLTDSAAPDGSHLTGRTLVDARHLSLTVYSAAMDRPITVEVQRPADPSEPRPVLYLLNGADGGVGGANWDHKAPQGLQFLGTKDINVVHGLPGPNDTLDGPFSLPGVGGLANQLTVGGVIEAATNCCTHNLQSRLNSLGIPATYDFTPTGTHSWGYWYDALVRSWPVLARGVGLPG
ncbi:hypothetical protein ACFC77_37925 [Nocardia colli]|uniref:hypothetical protein n=1 Tax=Nocardia colli TaxID=2545717 RepID=UPI0035D7FB11